MARDKWRERLYSLLDFLYPRRCVGCGAEGVWFCAACQDKIVKVATPTCFFCQTITKRGQTCAKCRRHYELTGVIVSAYHEGVIKEAIHTLKYDFISELAEPLSGMMAARLYQSRLKPQLVVPIPLHRARLSQRGFNQSALLASGISRRLGWTVNKNLVRVKNVTPQVELSGKARRQNMAGVFAWQGQRLNDKTILLVDDVATTATTLNEAAKVLRSAGARQVWGAVIAKG